MDEKWMTCDYVDGPGFVAWCRKRGILPVDGSCPGWLSKSLRRRIWDWENNGSLASVYVVDKLLVRAGFHLCDIPDSLWREVKPQQLRRDSYAKPADEETKQRAVARVLNGESIAQVARDIGYSARSVSKWVQGARRLQEAVA